MDLISLAGMLSYAAHYGQKRKYSDDMYFRHPERLAKRGKAMGLSDRVIAALYLHDVEEDCDTHYKQQMRDVMPAYVVALVLEVTNPSKDHPELRRQERKAMDREHLKHVSHDAKIMKFLDRIDNINEMVDGDRGFQMKYSQETLLLVEALLHGEHDALLDDLASELLQAVTQMQTEAMRKTLRR